MKKLRWKGIGGRPSKQMKELKMKPMPIAFFGKSIVSMMDDVNKLLDKQITKDTDKNIKKFVQQDKERE